MVKFFLAKNNFVFPYPAHQNPFSTLTTAGTVAFLSWAAWYDHHRRSKPDYLDNLVEKRKNELLENRRKNDPLYLVKSLSLCSKPDDPMAVQEYAMNLMTEGEMELEADKNRGASKIALGLAYFPMQQLQMIFMQLSQSMPQDILLLIRERLNVAKARVQSQRIESMMAAQNKKKESEAADKPKSAIEHLSSQAAGPIREITQSVDEEPKDVDSIDGDSEERIVDLGEVEDKEEPKIEELEEDEIDGTGVFGGSKAVSSTFLNFYTALDPFSTPPH